MSEHPGEPSRAGPLDPAGTPLGQRYLIHEVLGRGAMGVVYRATTRDTGEEVAAKVLRPELSSDATLVARFVQERVILTSIEDPHVVRMRDLVVEGDSIAIIAELVRGPNLRQYLAARGTLAPAAAASFTVQVLTGLAAAHARGVIHRDVKPENVLIDTTGAEPVARLTDFGIARLAHGPSLTRLTGLIGTPDYLPPELAERSHATPEADVYSVGIMLYELLCGVTPFSGGHPAAVLRAHLERQPGRIPGVPDELWDAIAAMLAKEPTDRPSAAAAAQALERLAPRLAGVPALAVLTEAPASLPLGEGAEGQATLLGRRSASNQGPGGRDESKSGKHPQVEQRHRRLLLLGGIGVGLVVLLVVGMALIFRGHPRPETKQFPPLVVGGKFLMARSYQLVGDTLTGTVELTSVTTTATDLVHEEVVPASVAKDAKDLRNIQPAQRQVVKSDPVLRFTFPNVPPGGKRLISYQARLPSPRAAGNALEPLFTDQQQAESMYNQQQGVPTAKVQGIAVTPTSISLVVDASAQVTLSGVLDNGGPAPFEALNAQWTSSHPDIASVVSGTVKGIKAGTARVTATAGNLSAGVDVAVVGTAPTQGAQTPTPPPVARTTSPGRTSPPPATLPSTAVPTPPPTPVPTPSPSVSPVSPPPPPSLTPGPPMNTTDAFPCFPPKTESDSGGRVVQRCPLIAGTIPVYDSPDKGNGAGKVGTLRGGDTHNWFVGQIYRSNYVSGQDQNRWWAYTLSDSGPGTSSQWGWVPETFFQGGANNERDRDLLLCDTQGNACH